MGERHQGVNMMKLRNVSALDCYTAAFGSFLFVSPWIFAYVSEAVRIEVWITGAAIAAASVAAIVTVSDWEEWVKLMLGAWLIISPWLLGFVHTKAMHVCVLLGALVAFVAALELWLVHFEPDYGVRSREDRAQQ
jgi:hypothetical protein